MENNELIGIVIDPGHGGEDSGAIGNNQYEKDYTLKISKYMYDRLRELGVPVTLTRDADVTLTPMERRVIEMQYFYGLRQKEVARALGTSQPSVSHKARRALKKMRAYFERTGSVEGEAERSGR